MNTNTKINDNLESSFDMWIPIPLSTQSTTTTNTATTTRITSTTTISKRFGGEGGKMSVSGGGGDNGVKDCRGNGNGSEGGIGVIVVGCDGGDIHSSPTSSSSYFSSSGVAGKPGSRLGKGVGSSGDVSGEGGKHGQVGGGKGSESLGEEGEEDDEDIEETLYRVNKILTQYQRQSHVIYKSLDEKKNIARDNKKKEKGKDEGGKYHKIIAIVVAVVGFTRFVKLQMGYVECIH